MNKIFVKIISYDNQYSNLKLMLTSCEQIVTTHKSKFK